MWAGVCSAAATPLGSVPALFPLWGLSGSYGPRLPPGPTKRRAELRGQPCSAPPEHPQEGAREEGEEGDYDVERRGVLDRPAQAEELQRQRAEPGKQ